MEIFFLAMLRIDFWNAFNLVDKSEMLRKVRVRCTYISLWVEFLYDQATRLYLRDGHITPATEMQQGDPLGLLLFVLVLHPFIHQIIDNCKFLLHVWYINDLTIVGNS